MQIAMKDMLLNNINFAYNEAIELIVSMGMIACKGELTSMAEDYKIKMDPLVAAYFEDARVRLSPHSYRELQFFSIITFSIRHSILLSTNPSAHILIHRLQKHGLNGWSRDRQNKW